MNSHTLLGVTGSPVLHSKSPLIFNTIFSHLGENGTYTRLAASDAQEAIFLFRQLELSGMNVTAPFKDSIMPLLDHLDDSALKIGGVNTVVRETLAEPGPSGQTFRIAGYNTDYIGVTQSLKDTGFQPKGKRCVVLGAGGAGRAAIYGLIKEGAHVTVVNRTYEKARQVAQNLGCEAHRLNELQELLKDAHLLVSTLSASLDIVPAQWLTPGLTVFDANYKKSLLGSNAATAGCTVIKGEAWLLNQAIPAYNHFLAARLEDSQLYGRLQEALRAPSAPTPRNIALVGFMGSGKSYIGQQLATGMNKHFVDLDDALEQQTGRSIPDIFEKDGEALFRKMEKETLVEQLKKADGVVISCGGGVVKNADNIELLKKHALVIWIYSSIETSLARIAPGSRPLLDCRNPAERAMQLLKPRIPLYAAAADIVVANMKEAAHVVEKINEEIGKTFEN